jgi:16S rRNA (cytidine1402-2'-O)-methyltransferase
MFLHKLLKTLAEFITYFGERQICVSRELSKLHEENVRGTVKEVLTHLKTRGEIVVVVGGKPIIKVKKSKFQKTITMNNTKSSSSVPVYRV